MYWESKQTSKLYMHISHSYHASASLKRAHTFFLTFGMLKENSYKKLKNFSYFSLKKSLIYCSYHATAALEEAQKLARQKIPSAAALQLHSFTFDDFGLENDEMLQVRKHCTVARTPEFCPKS